MFNLMTFYRMMNTITYLNIAIVATQNSYSITLHRQLPSPSTENPTEQHPRARLPTNDLLFTRRQHARPPLNDTRFSTPTGVTLIPCNPSRCKAKVVLIPPHNCRTHGAKQTPRQRPFRPKPKNNPFTLCAISTKVGPLPFFPRTFSTNTQSFAQTLRKR